MAYAPVRHPGHRTATRHLRPPDPLCRHERLKAKSAQQAGGKRTGEGYRQKSASEASKCELAIAAEFAAQGIGIDGIAASEATDIVSECIEETIKNGNASEP